MKWKVISVSVVVFDRPGYSLDLVYIHEIDSRDSTQVILRHTIGNPGAEELRRYLSPTRHPISRFQAESKSNDIAWSGIGRNYELVCESVC